jgi:hypothetical protein
VCLLQRVDSCVATNNPYFAADTTSHPEAEATDPADYIGVASVIYPQTAAPAMISVVKGIKTGKNPANREYRFPDDQFYMLV